MAPSRLFLLPQLPRRRACKLWSLAMGALAPVLLFLSWHRGSSAPTTLWTQPLLQAMPEPITALSDGTFTFYLNWSIYEDLFPHLQHYQCQEVIAQDKLFWLQPLFLLGVTPSQKQLDLVAHESRVFGDILMGRRPALTNYLRRTPNASHFIHGNIQRHAAVIRLGKYAVSRELYPLDHYPNFASGGGFIMAQQGLPALYRASLALPVFPLDDIYLAFLALVAQIPHRHDKAFRVWGIPKDELSAYQEAISIHGVSMERMEE
ncbi:Beta-1,3-galactosyltransferase brn, partial [Ophiophagus hannah]